MKRQSFTKNKKHSSVALKKLIRQILLHILLPTIGFRIIRTFFKCIIWDNSMRLKNYNLHTEVTTTQWSCTSAPMDLMITVEYLDAEPGVLGKVDLLTNKPNCIKYEDNIANNWGLHKIQNWQPKPCMRVLKHEAKMKDERKNAIDELLSFYRIINKPSLLQSPEEVRTIKRSFNLRDLTWG